MADSDMLVRELLRLGVYLQREGARMAREYGLTQQQFVVLLSVREQGPVAQREIVSDLLFEKSNVSKSIARLEKMGFVSTCRGTEDARTVLCEITARGERVAGECVRVMKRWNARWLRHLGSKELTGTLQALRGLGPM